MKKNYTSKGLITGCIVYAIFILVSIIVTNVYHSSHPEATLAGIGIAIVALFSLPLIPLGLLIGWMYGKIKNQNQK